MNIRGQGNVVALALAGLAVLIAATGTAVAVTANQVNIADPKTPTRIAHVDGSGRLTTSGVTATLDVLEGVAFGSEATERVVPISSPTTATLAVTAVRVDNSATSRATYVAFLVQTQLVGKNCDTSDTVSSILRYYSHDTLRPDDEREQDYSAPLIIAAPSGGAGYCLAIVVARAAGTPGTEESVTVQFAGYIAGGTYNGIGTSIPNRA